MQTDMRGMKGMRGGDPADMMARLGRSWGWGLAFGIITLAIGVLARAWPGRTVFVVAVVLGAQLTVMGLFGSVPPSASDALSGGTGVPPALPGVPSLITGQSTPSRASSPRFPP